MLIAETQSSVGRRAKPGRCLGSRTREMVTEKCSLQSNEAFAGTEELKTELVRRSRGGKGEQGEGMRAAFQAGNKV